MKTNMLILIAALTALAGMAFAAPAPKSHAKTVALICPVTGEKIASIKAAVGHSTYQGKTYYFCCPGCKPMFDKDPAKYIHPAVAAKP